MNYAVSDQIAHREIEGQTLLLLPNDSYLYTLNYSGKFLWQGLLEGHAPPRLISDLVEHFAISEQQASKDVKAFLTQLKRKGIIAAVK